MTRVGQVYVRDIHLNRVMEEVALAIEEGVKLVEEMQNLDDKTEKSFAAALVPPTAVPLDQRLTALALAEAGIIKDYVPAGYNASTSSSSLTPVFLAK
jgi:hypothetical protein